MERETEELRQRVKLYIAAKDAEGEKVSQEAFAKTVGISGTTFCRWYNGTYPSTHPAWEKKIADYLDAEEMRGQVRSAEDIGFVRTGIASVILATLDYCQLQKQMVCIYGDAGVGKTYTAHEWMRQHGNAIYFTASAAINSPKAVLKRFARALKTRVTGCKDDLYYEITDKLESMDVTIIVDEAQHLNLPSIEMIRSIKDETGIGVALIGNETVYSRLAGKQQAEFAQLFSRLIMRAHVLTDQITRRDIAEMYTGLGSEELDYLLDVAQSKYGLRGATFLYANAVNNDNTTVSGLKAMARNMGILA